MSLDTFLIIASLVGSVISYGLYRYFDSHIKIAKRRKRYVSFR